MINNQLILAINPLLNVAVTKKLLLLVINQLMSNTIFSISTGVFLMGLYLANCIYGKRIKYF